MFQLPLIKIKVKNLKQSFEIVVFMAMKQNEQNEKQIESYNFNQIIS